jgi:Fe2+ or Zn2+ uptake regulation protein
MDDTPHVHLVSLDHDEVREVTNDKLVAAFADILRKEGFAPKRFNLQIFGSFTGKKKG